MVIRYAPVLFHLQEGHVLSEDDGAELPSLPAARQEAELIARDLARNRRSGKPQWVRISDNTGSEVARIPVTWKR